jgi:hypothetical protein
MFGENEMKIRIRQEPVLGTPRWRIETKKWWHLWWQYADSCIGDDAKERALALAKQYANPTIIEVKQK